MTDRLVKVRPTMVESGRRHCEWNPSVVLGEYGTGPRRNHNHTCGLLGPRTSRQYIRIEVHVPLTTGTPVGFGYLYLRFPIV